MEKLTIDDKEVMTRKEYLKNKEKKKRLLNSKNIKIYIVLAILALLILYAGYQYYRYYKANNHLENTDEMLVDENVKNQKVYSLYYMSEGYTYNPKTTLNYVKSNSLEDSVIYENLSFINITKKDNYIFGIKEESLYKLNIDTNEITLITDNAVNKYVVYDHDVYYTSGEDNKLYQMNHNTLEGRCLENQNVTQILVDDKNIYLCVEEKTRKTLSRMDKTDFKTYELTEDKNISYIIHDINNIYFVNKDDDNRIYMLNKEGKDITKITEDSMIADIGKVEYINGDKYMFVFDNSLYYINANDENNLWKIDLETKKTEKVIHMGIDILMNYEDIIIYKVENEKGIYMYNLATGYSGIVSNRLITEVIISIEGE